MTLVFIFCDVGGVHYVGGVYYLCVLWCCWCSCGVFSFWVFKWFCSYCSSDCGIHLAVFIWDVVLSVLVYSVGDAHLVAFIWSCGFGGVHLVVFFRLQCWVVFIFWSLWC